MAKNSNHFVKYRTRDSRVDEQYITFSSRAPLAPPTPDEHPVINKLAQKDPEAAENVSSLINDMIVNEKKFFAWLGGNAENMELFMSDPVSALRQGAPLLPESFYEKLLSLPKVYAKKD